MASRLTAYRWQGPGSVHWLTVSPTGSLARSRAPTEREANASISAMARATGSALTVLVLRHPNRVVADA